MGLAWHERLKYTNLQYTYEHYIADQENGYVDYCRNDL